MMVTSSVCVLGCDVALTGLGYITSSDTKLRSYILYIGPVSILYVLHTMLLWQPFAVVRCTFCIYNHQKYQLLVFKVLCGCTPWTYSPQVIFT